MIDNRLLASALALVLVAGLVSPAFAQQFLTLENSPEVHLPPIDEQDEIFDNGRGDELIGGPTIDDEATNPAIWADDFVLVEDHLLTDVHFDVEIFFNTGSPVPQKQFEWFIYFDNGAPAPPFGVPGDLLASGQGINESQMFIEELSPGIELYRVWFDLDEPVFLEGGETYWLSIRADGDQSSDTAWLAKTWSFGNFLAIEFQQQPWQNFGEFDLNFILTGERLVGGESLPIDSTALMLAGLQTSAIWLIPVLAGAAGAGAFYIKTRMGRD